MCCLLPWVESCGVGTPDRCTVLIQLDLSCPWLARIEKGSGIKILDEAESMQILHKNHLCC
jgi:hypothetical protein